LRQAYVNLTHGRQLQATAGDEKVKPPVGTKAVRPCWEEVGRCNF